MDDIELFRSKLEDKYDRSQRDYMVTATGFLDLAQQSIVRNRYGRALLTWPATDASSIGAGAQMSGDAPGGIEPGSTRILLAGGYEDAERCVCFFLPDYAADIQTVLMDALCVLRISVSAHEKPPRHGDYLGSLVGLGVSREKLGDILVRQDGADVIVANEIADFLTRELTRVGHVPVSTEIRPLGELRIPARMYKEKTDSVASLRLDGIVASAFGLSRERAKEEIGRGLCFVNHTERKKIDSEVREKDVINLRHHGKVKLMQIGGMTRKGRISITYRIY